MYRIQVPEKTYKDSFDDELEQFKGRIKKRAHDKLQAAIREQEEEERKARLGPGGLDPVEVYEELPDVCLNHYNIKPDTLKSAPGSLLHSSFERFAHYRSLSSTKTICFLCKVFRISYGY